MPSAQSLKLDDDQLFALMKFKRNIHDIRKPHHDDYFLVRWLRARNWNVDDAEKMLRESMKWREKWEVDTKLTVDYEIPEIVKTYYPHGMCGYDKDGAPIIIIPFLQLDLFGLLHACPKNEMIKATIKMLENYLDLAAKTGANQVMAIIDLEGFNIRQFTYRPAAEFAIALIQMYEQNYPEILKKCFIINAPKVFAIAFSVVKNFLNEYTLSKIQIFKSDPKKWQPILLEHIDAEQLPKIYGGNMEDPDGNPRCTHLVKLGGKVPKSLYINKDDLITNEFTTVTVKKGDKLKLNFLAVDEGSFLNWEFRTDGHDIKFSVICTDEDGKKNIVVPPKRISSTNENEIGVIECDAPSTYTVIFDNSYSYLRNKKIHYNIRLVPPVSTLTIDTLPEESITNESS